MTVLLHSADVQVQNTQKVYIWVKALTIERREFPPERHFLKEGKIGDLCHLLRKRVYIYLLKNMHHRWSINQESWCRPKFHFGLFQSDCTISCAATLVFAEYYFPVTLRWFYVQSHALLRNLRWVTDERKAMISIAWALHAGKDTSWSAIWIQATGTNLLAERNHFSLIMKAVWHALYLRDGYPL